MKLGRYQLTFSREEPKAAKSEKGARYTDRAQHVHTPSDAMKIAAVYRAVSLISDSVATLPLIYKRRVLSLRWHDCCNKGLCESVRKTYN